MILYEFFYCQNHKGIALWQWGTHRVGEQDRFMENLAAESADVAKIIAALRAKYLITIQEALQNRFTFVFRTREEFLLQS